MSDEDRPPTQFILCNNRIHVFPFPEDCPARMHDDCDEETMTEIRENIPAQFPQCPFCFTQ